MFAPLPAGFAKLTQAIEAMGQFSLAPPPQMDDMAQRMRKLYAKARADGYQSLSKGAIRRLPYALWVDGAPSLNELEPDLVQAYWQKHLPAVLSQPRPAKRWLTPLFFVYCHAFKRERADFQDLAQRLRMSLQLAQGSMSSWMRELHASLRWFVPEEVGAQLGRKLATDPDPLPSIITKQQLWPGFLETRLASEAFAGALRLPNGDLSTDSVIKRIQGWSRCEVGGVRGQTVFRYPEHRILLADGLVRPWLQRQPPDHIRHGLISFLIEHYGDPRVLTSVHQGHHWQGVSAETIAAVKRWLVADTLRGFMRILQLTADEIWRYREKFWMAYYDRGVIEEAWIALGSQANLRAKQEFRNATWAPYGRLTSGATPDQSVLFLRIGDIQFMEWSHHGSLRACRVGDPGCPSMYQTEYSGTDLRLVRSMDFHEGQTQQPQLTHMNSDRGTWQRRARDFIAKHTGVRLNDQAIIG